MTADDAFDKLVEKNALNIPVATPSGDSKRIEKLPVAEDDTATAIRHRVDENTETIRVLDILDGDDVGDYRPRGDYDDEDEAFSTPTETDLEAVDEELVDAYAHGAQVLGRDIDPDDFFGDVADTQKTNGRDTEIEEASIPGPLSSLDKARRLRRFSYLPLSGMEHFETRARDIMASLSAQNPERPSLAITSVGRGSGQVELTIRLALAVAKRVDYRVLLADFDVRKPQIAKRLGLSSKYFTVTDVLRGSCPLGEALMMSEEDNLYVLPARPTDRDGDEVLNDRQVQTLMTQAHDIFDFVILSCGPMDHADATIICRHAGATALAAYCTHSSARQTHTAAQNLSQAGINVAGLLLTGVL